MRKLLFVFLILATVVSADQPMFCNTVDMNTTSDQQLSLTGKYIVRRVTVTDATISLTLAKGGVYLGPNKTGSVLVPATQAYSTLTTPAKFLDLTLQAPATNTVVNGQTVYFSLTTAQGSPATARMCVYGDTIN